MDRSLRKKLMDQADESQQILFEERWKEAHQGFTGKHENRGRITRHNTGLAENVTGNYVVLYTANSKTVKYNSNAVLPIHLHH